MEESGRFLPGALLQPVLRLMQQARFLPIPPAWPAARRPWLREVPGG